MGRIRLKRIYDKYEVCDGLTILVDRLWPRGARKSTPNVEIWMSGIAPTDELRKRYQHDPKKWVMFKHKYNQELQKNDLVEELVSLVVNTGVTTFVYAASDPKRNNAVVLKEFIERIIRKSH